MTTAATVLTRCADLDAFSASARGLERVYLSPEHASANGRAAHWMQRAGLTTWQDAAGNQWAMDAFVSVQAATLPATEFFAPGNVAHIMSA